jgi:hypothetical protein
MTGRPEYRTLMFLTSRIGAAMGGVSISFSPLQRTPRSYTDPELRDQSKFEYRISKSETNTKSKFLNVRNLEIEIYL